MARQEIFLGTADNDHTGTKVKLGGDMINDNFIELYAAEVLNTAKVSNKTHSGDAAGSEALTLATVNANVGTFYNPTITVDGKGRITAAANGTLVQKYSGTANLAAGVVTAVTTTVTSDPYSVLVSYPNPGTGKDEPVEVGSWAIVGGVLVLYIYTVDGLNGVKIKILY